MVKKKYTVTDVALYSMMGIFVGMVIMLALGPTREVTVTAEQYACDCICECNIFNKSEDCIYIDPWDIVWEWVEINQTGTSVNASSWWEECEGCFHPGVYEVTK